VAPVMFPALKAAGVACVVFVIICNSFVVGCKYYDVLKPI
jgi:hypothetical protein